MDQGDPPLPRTSVVNAIDQTTDQGSRQRIGTETTWYPVSVTGIREVAR
jgi:hypothetical protein